MDEESESIIENYAQWGFQVFNPAVDKNFWNNRHDKEGNFYFYDSY